MKHESLSSEDDKIQCNRLTSSDTEPAALVDVENSKESTTRKIRKEKIKKAKPSPSSREAYMKHSTPIFHVTWDGFVEQEGEMVGHACQLCEEDLLFAPVEGNHYEYYEQIDKPQNYPKVSVLACGHVFHEPCLDQATTEEQCRDPICYICLSFES